MSHTNPHRIVSDKASVAEASITCGRCGSSIKVICIYCVQGLINGAVFTDFSVSDVSSVDDALERQLKMWPDFRSELNQEFGKSYFSNYCPSCGERQDEEILHCEPGGVFFRIKGSDPQAVSLTPLTGTVRLNGTQVIQL